MAVDVSELLTQIEDYAQEVGTVTADEVERIVKDAAPVGQTGQLRDEITTSVAGGSGVVTITVDSPAEPSSWTDEGTEAHRIEGNPLLAFEMGGSLVIVHSVNHPGNAAQHWFDQPMPDYFQDALDIAAAQVTI